MPSALPGIYLAILMNETDIVPAFREPIVQNGRETIKLATLVRNSE